MADERKPEFHEWVTWDYLHEVIYGGFPGDTDGICARLKAGSQGRGVKLTADECEWVLECIKLPPKPKHRPPDHAALFRHLAVVMYSAELEYRYKLEMSERKALKSAVADTAKKFGCSRKQVYASRAAVSKKAPRLSWTQS